MLFRRHYLEVLRAQEAADQARHDAEQVLSDSPPTPSDIAPTLINGVDHGASASNRRCSDQQVANAWRAMSEAEREPFLQEAREAKARLDRELPALVWNTTRAAEGARRGPVAGKYFVSCMPSKLLTFPCSPAQAPGGMSSSHGRSVRQVRNV